MIWFVNSSHAYLLNPVWLQSWCKHRSHMSRCRHVMWELDACLALTVFVICGMHTASDIPLTRGTVGVGGRDCHSGRMWAPLCCFGVRFPGERRSLDEGRGSTCASLYFTPASSSAPCTCSPPMAAPHAPVLHSWPFLLLYAHPPTQSGKSCSGTEASLEEMPTSPHVSTCLL